MSKETKYIMTFSDAIKEEDLKAHINHIKSIAYVRSVEPLPSLEVSAEEVLEQCKDPDGFKKDNEFIGKSSILKAMHTYGTQLLAQCVAKEGEKVMRWVELTRDNIPNKEVVSKNKSGEILVGYIHHCYKDHGDSFYCDSDETMLDDVTHFQVQVHLPAQKPEGFTNTDETNKKEVSNWPSEQEVESWQWKFIKEKNRTPFIEDVVDYLKSYTQQTR